MVHRPGGLLRQVQLAQEMSVSGTPLREALRMLTLPTLFSGRAVMEAVPGSNQRGDGPPDRGVPERHAKSACMTRFPPAFLAAYIASSAR